MYRVRCSMECEYGHFGDVLSSMEEANEVCRAHGWTTWTFWVGSTGRNNMLVGEMECDSIDTYLKETEHASSDPAYMKAIRSAAQYVVQGSSNIDIWEPAPHLA